MLAPTYGVGSPYDNGDELTERRIQVSLGDGSDRGEGPKRIVSPLSPVRDFIAKRATRKRVPEPIEVKNARFKRDLLSPGMQDVELRSPELELPAKEQEKAQQRRTVWGMIDGWWDLGLLERMGTKKKKRQARGAV